MREGLGCSPELAGAAADGGARAAQELPPLWATDLGFDCIVADRNMTGNGYVLRGNTVSNNRGRGTILKGSQGMVENNRFTYNHFAGVLVRLPQNPTLL